MGEGCFMTTKIFLLVALLLISPSFSAKADPLVYMMPRNCSELLPDPFPFLSFFNSVGQGLVSSDRNLAKRIFKILALKDQLTKSNDLEPSANPVTRLIRKTLCFHRSKKGEIAIIMFDDKELVGFLRKNLKALERKIEDAIFQYEFELAQKTAFERQIEANAAVINRLNSQAREAARKKYNGISSNAKRKIRVN